MTTSLLGAESVRLVDGHWLYADAIHPAPRSGVHTKEILARYDNGKLVRVEVRLDDKRLWLIPAHSVLFVEVLAP